MRTSHAFRCIDSIQFVTRTGDIKIIYSPRNDKNSSITDDSTTRKINELNSITLTLKNFARIKINTQRGTKKSGFRAWLSIDGKNHLKCRRWFLPGERILERRGQRAVPHTRPGWQGKFDTSAISGRGRLPISRACVTVGAGEVDEICEGNLNERASNRALRG